MVSMEKLPELRGVDDENGASVIDYKCLKAIIEKINELVEEYNEFNNLKK